MFRCLSMFVLWLWLPYSAVAQDIPRQRISYRGSVVPQVNGPAKWAVNNSVIQETTPGDLFLVETKIEPNEKQAIAIYAWAVPLKEVNDEWVLDGEPFRVKASRLGKTWGYESKTFGSAGAFSMVGNTSSSPVKRQAQIFLPYSALDLPPGKNYEIRYELAVTVGNNFLDQFFISQKFRRNSVHGAVSRTIVVYSAEMTGVKVLDFTLDGAKDDIPESIP